MGSMPVGRPPKYKTPEAMQRVIDLYFLACRVHQTMQTELLEDLDGDDLLVVNDIEDLIPTVAGLSYVLGMSRRAFVDYAHKDAFLPTIKRARQRIEISLEQRLGGNNVTGAIFNLKNNFGWKDKTEQDVNATVETKDMSAVDALRKIIESKSA